MIDIKNISSDPPKHIEKDDIEKETKDLVKEIGELSRIFEADKSHSLLVILQGMDGSGKDGVTREVFGRISSSVICNTAFKKPTEEEMAHDFLWRIHKVTPGKGQIKIFNRSHYEDVLIQRIHKWIDEEKVMLRFEAIKNFEKLLTFDNNTTVLKFFLHLSHEKQLEKLQERIDDPTKNWKYNPNDAKESELWDQYMNAYNDIFNLGGIEWHIIPADKEWFRNYQIAKVVLDTLKKMNLKYPTIS